MLRCSGGFGSGLRCFWVASPSGSEGSGGVRPISQSDYLGLGLCEIGRTSRLVAGRHLGKGPVMRPLAEKGCETSSPLGRRSVSKTVIWVGRKSPAKRICGIWDTYIYIYIYIHIHIYIYIYIYAYIQYTYMYEHVYNPLFLVSNPTFVGSWILSDQTDQTIRTVTASFSAQNGREEKGSQWLLLLLLLLAAVVVVVVVVTVVAVVVVVVVVARRGDAAHPVCIPPQPFGLGLCGYAAVRDRACAGLSTARETENMRDFPL